MLYFTGAEIPDIGFRACIDGGHFNIKLSADIQTKFNEIAEMWNGKF